MKHKQKKKKKTLNWISVIPSEGLGLHLEPSEFQVAIKWWLGLDTSGGAMKALCPGSVLDPLGHHALTCKQGDVVSHHLSVRVEAGSNLTLDHSHSRPADILVPNWSVDKPAAFDLSVTSTLLLNVLLEAGLTAGAAARATELRKHEANDGKCRELGWVCVRWHAHIVAIYFPCWLRTSRHAGSNLPGHADSLAWQANVPVRPGWSSACNPGYHCIKN